jgi:protein-tyrosine-phosphatase
MNAVRSPMAAAILAHLAGWRVRVSSAGVKAGHSDPYAVAVMDEIGIDISEHAPRTFAELGDETYDLIITLSPEAHHHALELTRTMAADVEYWPTLDATVATEHAARAEMAARYRAVRDEMFLRIKDRFGLEGGPTV